MSMWKNRIVTYIFSVLLFSGCHPEMPVTSVISIEADGLTFPVNKELYGLTIEEINHAVDGGLYAELIQNRSFEDGVPPANCPYDPVRKVLTTPNGWTIPFIPADSVSGWRRLSPGSYMYPDTKELINDKNRRSLLVSVSATAETGRGGVAAEGYGGIPVREGEKYDLSLFMKGVSMVPKTISIALSDSTGATTLSDVFRIAPGYEWKKYQHTFTATASTDKAILTITSDSSTVFWLDVVSLFPQNTWKGRPNGLRPDLMEMIAALNPQFIRFPGGSFVEGYTAGTYPVWKETVGDISTRKYFWNIYAYGTTNGVGYHEYLQMCEDLGAEPIYVINSGVTNQNRRPRYEDITTMDKLVQDALDAIAYANAPADSTLGAMRAAHGHAEPFHLKYVEIGSENYGPEYTKRFNLFKKAINETYPDITVISSSVVQGKMRNEWSDAHFYANEPFLISNYDRYGASRYIRRSSPVFIGEFKQTDAGTQGSLRAAIGEACFLVGAENSQDMVKRLAYSPILGNTNYPFQRYPAILFNNGKAVGTPSYYLLKMFADNRGEEVLKTTVDTYLRPQVTFGRPGIEMFDNSYEIKEAKIDDVPIADATIMTGGWKVNNGMLIPDANRWNYILAGNPETHDYTFSADIKRTKGSGQIQFRVRDNGLSGEQSDYVGMTIGSGICEFYRQSGGVRDTLRTPVVYPFQSNRWYRIKMECRNDQFRCYINDTLIHEVSLSPLPSLVSVATLDKSKSCIILKVVNTTQHEEKTELHINGIEIKNTAEVTQLTGAPDACNTFLNPETIVPEVKQISFSMGGTIIYSFPPNSVTILKLNID
ncbi:glycoside hydrolase [Parabacteroides sp. AM08-6]|nr:glycoside hydrolase [Parabacteroides sp. AM08-6]